MATPYTGYDGLGVYLSGDPSADAAYGSSASLGGSRLAAEVLPLAFHIEQAIPQVAVEYVSGTCGPGVARLKVSGADALRFSAPGESLGPAVTVAVGQTVVVPSATASKWIRVTRDRPGALRQTPMGATLTLAPPYNNAIAQGNALVSDCATLPYRTYRALFLFNRTDKPITNLTVTCFSSTSIAIETPSEAGIVQVLPNETTAPAGVTFPGNQVSVPLLSPNTGVVLWIRRTLGVGTAADPDKLAGFTATWTDPDGSRTLYYSANFAVAGTARYEAWVAQGGPPDLAGSPTATSETLPLFIDVAKPPSGTYTYHIVIRRLNAYGILGNNLHASTITIDPDGYTVADPVSAPTAVAMESGPGGTVKLSALYASAADAAPADTWLVYARTDGTDPNPATDTPTEIAMSESSGGLSYAYGSRDAGMFGASTKHLATTLGPYDWGTELRVLVRVKRSDDGAASTNTAVSQHTVETIPPIPVSHRQALLGYAYGADQPPQARNTTTYSAPYSVRIVRCPGEAQFWIGNECPLRAVVTASGDAVARLDPAWVLDVDATALGAGTGLVEAVSATVVYINVAGTRRVKFDTAAKRVTAAAFWLGTDALTDCPSPAAVAKRPAETLMTVWDPAAGRHVAYAAAKADGTFALAHPIALLGA